jgi:hypothetical protein
MWLLEDLQHYHTLCPSSKGHDTYMSYIWIWLRTSPQASPNSSLPVWRGTVVPISLPPTTLQTVNLERPLHILVVARYICHFWRIPLKPLFTYFKENQESLLSTLSTSMAHDPCEEASRPKHGKENIVRHGIGGGKELPVRCFHVRYFVHRGCKWGMARLLVGTFTVPSSLSKRVILQAPSKLYAWSATRGLALMPHFPISNSTGSIR